MTNSSHPLPSSELYNRRLVLIQTAAEIAALSITATNLDNLLDQTVNLITQRFGYYHASVFLLEDSGQVAILRASAGEAAAEILAQRTRIIVGSRSIIGWVTSHNQYRLASDVSQEFFYQQHELLAETRSELAIPISVRSQGALDRGAAGSEASHSQVLGAIDVQHTLEGAFDPDAITVLQTITNHIAAVVQNYKLLDATRRSLAEVSALYHASNRMTHARNVQDIQSAILPVLQGSPYLAQLLVIQPGSVSAEDKLVVLAPQEIDEAALPPASEPADPDHPALALGLLEAEKALQAAARSVSPEPEGLEDAAPLSLKPYLWPGYISVASPEPGSSSSTLPGTGGDSPLLPLGSYARSLGLGAAAFIPITRLNRLEMLILIGTMAEKSSIFSLAILQPDALQAYTGLADLATTALERVFAMRTMEKRLTALQTLNAVSQAVSVQTDLNQLYSVIHNEVRSLMGEISFLIAFYQPEEETISVPYMFEMGSAAPTELPPFAMGEGLSSIIIRTRQPLMLVEDTERRSSELGARLYGAPAKSWLGVPLQVAGEVIGVIVVQDIYQERRFDEDDLRLMVTLASQVAVAIRNARLLESMHKQAERERIINEITGRIRSSGSAHQILQTATEEVAHLLGASRARLVLKSATVQEPVPPLPAEQSEAGSPQPSHEDHHP